MSRLGLEKVSLMKKRRSAEQIVGLLRQADVDFGKSMNEPLPVAALIQAREPSIQAGSVVSRISVSKKVFEVPSVIIESVIPVLQLLGSLPHVCSVITARARRACR